MAAKGPRTLQTLPSEGLVLERVIDDMREEYGYPATPQEYRLIVRVATEDPERLAGGSRHRSPPGAASGNGSGAVRPTTEAVAEERGGDAGDDDGPAPARRGRMRRRRRGRGRPGASGSGDAGSGDAGSPSPEGGGSPEGGRGLDGGDPGGEGDAPGGGA